MGKKKEGVEDLPDHLRCGRSDGRSWRCRRRVMDGMKLCEIHYLQGRHRQIKVQVPEELKIQRNNKNVVKKSGSAPNNAEIRARKVSKMAKLMKRKKRKKRSSAGELEAMDEALRKKQSNRSDMQLDLIRMVLKREVEKRKKNKQGGEVKKKKKKNNMKKKKKKKKEEMEEDRKKELPVDEEYTEKELTRELPNGFMAISPVPSARDSGNVGSHCDVKVGVNLETVNPRRFRSKNIERLPAGTLQVVPYGNLKKCRRNKCHWCQRSGPRNMIKCSSCKKELFCLDCIKERYLDTQDEVKIACPVCRGTCTCNECLASQNKDSESKELSAGKSRADRISRVHYLIYMLLPVVKQVIEERNAELEIEAILTGTRPSDIHVKEAKFGCNEDCCNNCNFPILDIHRSCPKCSYNLCISCCHNFRQGSVPIENGSGISKSSKRRKACRENVTQILDELNGAEKQHIRYMQVSASSLSDWKSEESSGGISCPPTELGGCGDSYLELQCVFPVHWIKDLEVSAEEIVCSYEFPETLDKTSCCSLCVGKNHKDDGSVLLQEAAAREISNDNYLFYPMPVDIAGDKFEHFQKHWGKGHPVIVRNVLQTKSNLSWDPLVIFCGYLEKSIARYENNKDLLIACLDWCEVEINISQYFCGSLRSHTERRMWNEMLKLKGWLSSDLFKEQFPAHFAEVMNGLPLQEYINPSTGLLNIAANLPPDIPKPEQGPSVYISYTCADDIVHADYVTKLSCASYDVVNILAHSTDIPISTDQCTKIRKLLKRHNALCQTESAGTSTEQTKGKSPPNVKNTAVMQNVNETESTSTRSLVDSDADKRCDSDADEDHRNRTHGSNDDGKQNLTACSCAQWDVFRRQDATKLVEYLKKHCNEFSGPISHPQQQMVHPILDETFFLDTSHKKKLKEELEIEPWTFEQHVGEAVIIPAGCPYQIRNPKGCVHVVLDFVSPENVTDCIQLIDEIRLLPGDHKAKLDTRQVKRMALHSISEAIKEIRELKCTM